MAMTFSHLQDGRPSVPLERGSDMQKLSRRSTQYIMGRSRFFGASTENVARSAT